MYILILAATRQEIAFTIDRLHNNSVPVQHHAIDFLISGIGSVSCTYSLTTAIFKHKPDFIIQAGIAGSFSADYPPCTTVLVKEEALGDLGVMEEEIFTDIFDLQLADSNAAPFAKKVLPNPTCGNWKNTGLPLVHGITVNEITTNTKRIAQLKEKYNAEIESMEGAALHYVCLQQKIPFIQIRTVSNYVGERNKSNWQLSGAIQQLNESLITFIQQIP